jgi:general nucleoside transport system permease protein
MRALIGLFVGIFICLCLVTIAGENPFAVAQVLFKSSFGSSYDFGLTLFFTTSLIFTGLSVSIAFQAGLFNIGAEGQLTIGALAMALAGLLVPGIHGISGFVFCLLAGLLFGFLWGAIPGLLKAWRGSHEVIVTMMLNFIAAGIASYFVVGPFKNPESQNPETASLPAHYTMLEWDPIHKMFSDSPANFSFIIAILMCFIVWFFFKKTFWGFEIKASGQNAEAAAFSGLNPKRAQIMAMSLAGAMAAFVGLNEVLGYSGKFKLGFSPEYGFIGIAVALLARNNTFGIIASAFLFAALQKGSADLDFETTYITRDFSRILQAIIILSVVVTSSAFIKPLLKGFRWKTKP